MPLKRFDALHRWPRGVAELSVRWRLLWGVALIVALLGSAPVFRFIASSGQSWNAEVVEDFVGGRVWSTHAAITNIGFKSNLQGWYLPAATSGTFVYRISKPAGVALGTQVWFYGGGRGITSSISVSLEGSPSVELVRDVNLDGMPLDLPAAASDVAIEFSAVNRTRSDVLVLDKLTWGKLTGVPPPAPPGASYAAIGLVVGLLVAAFNTGRRRVVVGATLGVLGAFIVATRLTMLAENAWLPLDPDAVGYRLYADRFEWWPPWGNGLFGANFSFREPFFILVTHAFFTIFGSSDFHLRVTSALLSIGAMVATVVAARRVLSWPLATTVGFLVATNAVVARESVRGLRTELEMLLLLVLYLQLDTAMRRDRLADSVRSGLAGAALTLTRTFYLPAVLVGAAIAFFRGRAALRRSVVLFTICVGIAVLALAGHRFGMLARYGDANWDTSIYARAFANSEKFLLNKDLPHPELFPTLEQYINEGPEAGPHITYMQYLFELHSPGELIRDTVLGYGDTFISFEGVTVPMAPRFLNDMLDWLVRLLGLAGLAALAATSWRDRRRLLIPALVGSAILFAAYQIHLGAERYRLIVMAYPLVVVAGAWFADGAVRRAAASAALPRLFERAASLELSAQHVTVALAIAIGLAVTAGSLFVRRVPQTLGVLLTVLTIGLASAWWATRSRAWFAGVPGTMRYALVSGTAVGFLGTWFVSMFPESLSVTSGPLTGGVTGVLASSVVIAVSFAVVLWRPVFGAWLLVASILLPIRLVPVTLTTVVTTTVYAAVLVRLFIRREQPQIGRWTASALGLLAAAIALSVAGAWISGTALQSGAGARNALAFVYLLGVSVAVPYLTSPSPSALKELLTFTVSVCTGMAAWTFIEFWGRAGALPLTFAAWINDPLTKSTAGAVSGGFVGGGPNTFAVFLTVALMMAIVLAIGGGGRISGFALFAVTATSFALAFTYSRGAHAAVVVGIGMIAWLGWSVIRRRSLVLTLGIPVGFLLLAYGSSLASAAPTILQRASSDGGWRAFVADPAWSIDQRLPVPATGTSRLWAKIRAAAGTDYKVQVAIEETTIYEGVTDLPAGERQWVAFDFDPSLLAGKSEVLVTFRLVGRGDQMTRYFEIEGTPVQLAGILSHFNGPVRSANDLSPDPGDQTGAYAIWFSTTDVTPTSATASASPSAATSTTVSPSATAASSLTPVAQPRTEPPLSEATPPALPTQYVRAERSLPQTVIASIPQIVTENDRWTLWGIGVQSFVQHPIFGIGFYSASVALHDAPTNIQYTNFHNQFLEFLADSGIVGFLGLVGFFAILLAVLIRHGRDDDRFAEVRIGLIAAFVALIVALQFGSFFADSRIAGLTWILAGLVGAIETQRTRMSDEPRP
jgi:hypothetical protein